MDPRPEPLAALVVDPDPDTRRLHAVTLASVVEEIDEAEDGAEALAKALARRPTLVVSELSLPRLDGFALFDFIRAEPALRSTAIVAVTGMALPADSEKARLAGADSVLIKPVDPERVRMEAQRLLRESQRLRLASQDTRARVAVSVEKSRALLEHSARRQQRMLSRRYARERTTTPPLTPPDLRCPSCDQPLIYSHSNSGGVSAKLPEQWDYFECPRCGPYQYRHRTHRLKRVAS